jgi:hypothetical protein
MMTVKPETTRGRDVRRGCGIVTPGVSGAETEGAADTQKLQQRCKALSGAVPSPGSALPEPWQMTSAGADASIAPACAVANPVRNA